MRALRIDQRPAMEPRSLQKALQHSMGDGQRKGSMHQVPLLVDEQPDRGGILVQSELPSSMGACERTSQDQQASEEPRTDRAIGVHDRPTEVADGLRSGCVQRLTVLGPILDKETL